MTLPETQLTSASQVDYLFPTATNITLGGHLLSLPISITTPLGASALFTASVPSGGGPDGTSDNTGGLPGDAITTSARAACSPDFYSAFLMELQARLGLNMSYFAGVNCSAATVLGRRSLVRLDPLHRLQTRQLAQAFPAAPPSCGNSSMELLVKLSIPADDKRPLEYYKEKLGTVLAEWARQNSTGGLALCPPDMAELQTSAQLSILYTVPLNDLGTEQYSKTCGANQGTRMVDGLENLQQKLDCGVTVSLPGAAQSQSGAAAPPAGGSSSKGMLPIIIGACVAGGVALMVCAALGAILFGRRRRKRKREQEQVRPA